MIQRAASILKMKDGSLLPLEIRYNFYHLSSSSAMFRFEVQLTTRHSFLNCARSLNNDMAEWSGKVYEVPFFLTPEYDGEKRTFCAQLETYKWDLQLFKRTLINHFLQSAWFFIFFYLQYQQKFGIKTAGLEDKSTACQMLVCYARELKEGFAPYTEQVVKLMVPLLKFYFHDLVRTAAAESLPFLLECAKIKGDGYLRQMWAYMCPEVLKAMSAEPEPEVQILIMDALARCIETLGVGCMTADYFTELGTILHDIIDTHKNRQIERQREYHLNHSEVIITASSLAPSSFAPSTRLAWFTGKSLLWLSCWSIWR